MFLDHATDRLWPRWIFLRALGLIFFSAFYSLFFQVLGLVGKDGILPTDDYLYNLARSQRGIEHFWAAPSLFWITHSDQALVAGVLLGAVASLALTFNVWPRFSAAICTLLFLSFVSILQDFSSYQSDGMLMEAGLLSLFFAPPGFRPGLGRTHPPLRLASMLLQWLWFRIYFGSGVVKLLSGDPHWRHFTALDEYYQNGPLPTWVGWYVQQLPHWFHAATTAAVLAVELGLVWLLFAPRRIRLACALVTTAFQIGIILTANYAFLNYLVLALGLLLFDDRAVEPVMRTVRRTVQDRAEHVSADRMVPDETIHGAWPPTPRRAAAAVCLGLLFYASVAAWFGPSGIAGAPVRLLAPFRIGETFGLFAVMTPARFEIEFQGTRDGVHWTPYPFRYKPQNPYEHPGLYAPYQPRFDWNLWFASLASWRASPWVVVTQARLLQGSAPVLRLFRFDPFASRPPVAVRTVLWQYWFTDLATKRRTGAWWRRQELGMFAGTLTRQPDGTFRFQPDTTEQAPGRP